MTTAYTLFRRMHDANGIKSDTCQQPTHFMSHNKKRTKFGDLKFFFKLQRVLSFCIPYHCDTTKAASERGCYMFKPDINGHTYFRMSRYK